MDKKYFDIAVGMHLTTNARHLLVAPQGSYLNTGDIVGTMKGEYRIMYANSYQTEDNELVTALMVALNMDPERIVKRIVEERFDWEDEYDDALDG